MTVSVAPALMTMPLVPDTSTPASGPSELIVIDLVMVTAPNAWIEHIDLAGRGGLGDRARKVLHGAVRRRGVIANARDPGRELAREPARTTATYPWHRQQPSKLKSHDTPSGLDALSATYMADALAA